MPTPKFDLRVTAANSAENPVVSGDPILTATNVANFFRGVSSGSLPGGAVVTASYDQVAASGTLIDNGLTAADVAGAAINGVDATATYATSPNHTLTLIKNKVNNGGNTPNDKITKAVFAKRYFTDATGYFTLAGASGSLSPAVDGTSCTFTAVADDAADAKALALAINAQAVASLKVFAYSDGVDKCYVVAAGTNRATITLSTSSGVITASVGGFTVSVTYASSDTNTAALLAAAINADPRINQIARASSAAGVVTVIAIAAGDQMPAIGARGTNVTVGGTTTPSTTITLASASGVVTAYVNGVPTSVTWVTSDTVTAALLAAAITANPAVNSLVTATSAAGVVTVTSRTGISLSCAGTGATASATFLTGAGTYGGVAGNALTLTSATGVTRSGTTLTGGVSGVSFTSIVPGVAGNWITLAAAGAAAAHVTASATALASGAETSVVIKYT